MIWTIKIKLLSGRYADADWEGSLEIESSSSLLALHYAIQRAVNFDNDHLYRFFVARTPRSRETIDLDDESSVTIEQVFPLEKGRKLFYLFDFGASWLFQVSRSRKKPFEAKQGIEYPRLVGQTGEKPEQYPGWDE